MKLIGALFVLLGSSSIGFMIANQIALRPKQLQELKTALEMLKTEIDYGFTPLPVAFAKLSNNIAAPIADIFVEAKSNLEAGLVAHKAWREAVTEVFPETSLLKEDRDLLLEIGYNLGNSNSSDQIRHLDLAQEKINNSYQKAIKEKNNKVKIWRYFGVLIGLLVVIIIV